MQFEVSAPCCELRCHRHKRCDADSPGDQEVFIRELVDGEFIIRWVDPQRIALGNLRVHEVGSTTRVLDTQNGNFICRSSVGGRSEEHTSELQSRFDLVCRLLLEKKKKQTT